MNSSRSPRFRQDRRALALVIVLAFIVLLTGLTVAFFSSSVLYRQISNSSANEAKVDLFAQGAMDTIVGDLKQEIAAGSNATLYTDANSNVVGQVYRPFNANTAVPALALKGSSSEQSGINFAGPTPAAPAPPIPAPPYAPNLLKRSAYTQNFFPAGSDTGSANYNSGNTSETIPVSATPSAAPPSAAAHAPSNRAANVATTATSQNGRSISLARWNKALLLPKAHLASDTDFTPINPANSQDVVTGYNSPPTGTSEFVAPDWVLVARDGSNPTGAFSSGMATSASGTSTVIGRYGYAIYDEGGLLDANVAGCPAGKNNFGVINSLYASQVARKNAMPYADLTQLPGISSLALTPPNNSRQMQVIQSLVGWRNYATAQPSGGTLAGANFAFPTPSPSPISSLTNFSIAALTNTNGFLRTSNTAIYKGQTDRMLASRQELLRLMLNGIAQQGPATTAVSDRANIQNALQYLGTFSRSLNQPSFVPDSTRPKVLPIASGGNDSYQSPAADNKINPALQSVRVGSATGWTRNDGSTAVVGEPLLKKRFALNRLAWLSYSGPAATNLSNPAVVQTITLMGGNPANPQDPVYQFVAQGTDDGTSNTNIPKYFGLTWDSANLRWKYIHGISGSSGRIMTLAEVAAANREPDFFELLKAAINVGSLGKAYSYIDPASNPNATYPSGYQFQRDNSVDGQVIQIGANIIDQFDCDGYPTRIAFSDGVLFGGRAQEYRGIEDLPYIYRIREGKVTLRDSNPTQTNLPTVSATLQDSGLAAILQEPEIWNPHGWNSVGTDPGLRPTSLRIVAISTDPNNASSGPSAPLSGGATTVSAGFQSLAWSGTSFGGPIPNTMLGPGIPSAWNEQTTEMDFQIPTNAQYLFREPTLLIKPNVPANSGLTIGSKNILKNVQSTNFLTSMWRSTQIVSNGGTDNQQYIGFLAGYGPVAWNATVPIQGIDANNPATPTPGVVEATSAYLATAISGITYRLQYLDPSGSGNWLTYDEKFADYIRATAYNNGYFWTDLDKTFNTYNASASPPTADNIISTELGETCFDPRTSRFGMQYVGGYGYINNSNGAIQFPIRQNRMNVGWAAPSASMIPGAVAQLALATMRPDDNAGFQLTSNYPTAAGWYPTPSEQYAAISPGMYSQNNPAEVANPSNRQQVGSDGQGANGPLTSYFADADNVVRRSMGGYVPTNTSYPAVPPASGKPSGLPTKTAMNYSTTVSPATNGEISSRPVVLNRPFRSPAELGYVFSGTPWRNLDMSTPESGAAALMDVFSINDTDNINGMVAGKVDLNTRQAPVVVAVLGGASAAAGSYTGAYKDEFNPVTASSAPSPAPNISATDASNIGAALINRNSASTAGLGPLTNVSELAGKWNSSVSVTTDPSASGAYDGSQSYTGFSGGPPAVPPNPTPPPTDLGTALGLNTTSGATEQRVSRFREAAIRPLASMGQTRTWNLMIDLVAQTGRYPTSAGSAANPLAAFLVEGEQRYWIHLAIDRVTGNVIDKQIEVVKE